MKVGFLSTLETNIGDELIRTGIETLLRSVLNEPCEKVVVNKHNPASAYPQGHCLHRFEGIGNKYLRVASTELASLFCYREGGSLFDDCDLIIQSGMPVFFDGAWRTEWSFSIWHEIIGRLSCRIPVWNLAAGSCYPWGQHTTVKLKRMDRGFFKKIRSYCCVTTVRDPLAKRIADQVGDAVELLPCTAFLAGYGMEVSTLRPRYVFLNYMRGAGHRGWMRQADASRWEDIFSMLVQRLQKRYELAFICHNQDEYEAAKQLAPEVKRFFPQTPDEYLEVASMGIAGVFNRMHACVGMAGLGIPSVGVGMDSRLLMVRQIGLPCFYAEDANVDTLEKTIDELVGKREKEALRLRTLSEQTFSKYSELIQHCGGLR